MKRRFNFKIMKYTNAQKRILKESKKERFKLKFHIENKVKNNYPIEVEVIDGYYIIPSRLNTTDLL